MRVVNNDTPPFDQDRTQWDAYVDRLTVRQRIFVMCAAMTAIAVALWAAVTLLAGLVAVDKAGAADHAGPRDGCEYVIVRGDTMVKLGTARGLTVAQLMSVNPQVRNANRIIAGETLDVCHPDVVDATKPVLVEVGLPGDVENWAQAVVDTRPDWATDADVRFLVAVSGPESNHGTDLWNPGDAGWAGGARYLGSYGNIQIRVLANPARYPSDWYRDRAWLEESLDHQAQAAWIVLNAQSRRAWGPVKDGKLPNEQCAGSSNVKRCQTWWAVADQALAKTR